MKKLLLLSLLLLAVLLKSQLLANGLRQDSLRKEIDETEIHLSPAFQRDLWGAFSFTPEAVRLDSGIAPIMLDRTLLREWVGEVCIDQKAPEVKLPSFDLFPKAQPRSKPVASFDFCGLTRYLLPSEIKLIKSQAIAREARPLMDRIFPMEGLTRIVPTDTMAIATEKGE